MKELYYEHLCSNIELYECFNAFSDIPIIKKSFFLKKDAQLVKIQGLSSGCFLYFLQNKEESQVIKRTFIVIPDYFDKIEDNWEYVGTFIFDPQLFFVFEVFDEYNNKGFEE